MSYRQLNEGQRYQISTLLSQEFSMRAIAKNLNIAPSTIYRELQKNQSASGKYCPDKAQRLTLSRRLKPKPKRISENTRCAVELMRELDWSPELSCYFINAITVRHRPSNRVPQTQKSPQQQASH